MGSFFAFLNGISFQTLVVAIHGKWFLCSNVRMYKKMWGLVIEILCPYDMLKNNNQLAKWLPKNS